MFKTLLKKQFLEINSFYFQDRKTGKRRSKGGMIAFIVLYAWLFIFLGFTFFGVAAMLGETFFALGMNWLYFAFMGTISVFLGVFGGVFNTFNMLYKAKDNELLLSLPVKPRAILGSRMIAAYAMSLMYEAVAFVPTVIYYWISVKPNAARVVFPLLFVFILGIFVLTLVCVLGYIVAAVSSRLTKKKSFITTLVSLVLFGAYYVVCFKINDLLTVAAANTEKLSAAVKSYAAGLYAFGLAADGSVLWFIAVTAAIIALFAVLYALMSKTFIKIATANRAAKKAVYKEAPVKENNIKQALFKKELKRFLASPTYMLNSALGAPIMIIAGVILLVKSSYLTGTIAEISAEMPQIKAMIPVIFILIVGFCAGTGSITAPSLSLEGKNLWLLQSLPINPADIFNAKQRLHITVIAPPAVFATVCCGIALKLDFTLILYSAIFSVALVQFLSAFGLFLNIKKPNFDWTNETIVVKQSMPVMIALFGGWLLALILFAAYYLLKDLVPAQTYILIAAIVLELAGRYMNRWIATKGVEEFKNM